MAVAFLAPVAGAAVVLAALVVPASKDPEAAASDVAGLILSSATMALLVYTIIEAPSRGWSSITTAGKDVPLQMGLGDGRPRGSPDLE